MVWSYCVICGHVLGFVCFPLFLVISMVRYLFLKVSQGLGVFHGLELFVIRSHVLGFVCLPEFLCLRIFHYIMGFLSF